MTARIDSLIEPKCTGMCGALAINDPAASNSAQLKSSRSLMLTEYAVFCRRNPICSAMFMNRLLKTSSITGSARVPTAVLAGRGRTRRNSRFPAAVMSARQPGSTTIVALRSAMMAGPSNDAPGSRLSLVEQTRRTPAGWFFVGETVHRQLDLRHRPIGCRRLRRVAAGLAPRKLRPGRSPRLRRSLRRGLRGGSRRQQYIPPTRPR